MSSAKTIYLLIGPKGSGKTFIGHLLTEHFGIPFPRVEDIALQVKRDRAVDDPAYVWEVFAAIETAVRERLRVEKAIAFESTGLSDAFDQMLAALRKDFNVLLIRIQAEPERCLERVRSRDAAMHVDVSDSQVRRMNEAVASKGLECDVTLVNEETGTEGVLRQLRDILLIR